MEDLKRKYAEVLLKECLKIEENQPLLINADIERIDFVRIVTEVAFELGIKDIHYDLQDPYIKHDALKELEIDELKNLDLWDKSIWNEYAKKDAAFLMLASVNPGLMKDINSDKLKEMTKYSYETRKDFDDLRDKSELAWCIAAVPTKSWAETLYPNEEHPVDKLWNEIFDMCLIKENNPQELWKEKISKLKERANKLTKYQFKKLIYKNDKGTNLEIGLPKNHIWATGNELIKNKKEVIVNFPTEEVFTSPDYTSVNGIVYSSKPLSYQDTIINNFYIEFKDGKAINCKAEEGEEVLKSLINICSNSDYLGEVALVPYDSPISNTNQVFLETLFDENASCHLALGDSFPECIEDGVNIDKKTLYNEYKLNDCTSHVDFMVGTKDLDIIGITIDNKKIEIFKNGNFTKEFE